MLFNKITRKLLTLKDLQYLCCKHKSGAQGKSSVQSKVFTAWNRTKKDAWPQCPLNIYLVNEQTVDLLVKSVSEDLRHEKAVIFEASPGAGHVTKALLKYGANRVRIFLNDDESISKYTSDLKELQAKYPQNLEICFSDLLNINRVIVKDEEKVSSNLLSLLSDVEVHSWNDSPPIKLIAPLSPVYECLFLRSLFNQMAYMTGIFTCGRTEVFAFVSDYEYYYISGRPEEKDFHRYTHISVIYNTLFNVEHIAEVPYTHFSPPINIAKQIRTKKNRSICHLIKLTPRKELTEKLSASLLPDYLFFTRQAMVTRKANIIAYFEKWVPGCGPKLIKFGIPLFKRFGDLNPHQFFDLFCEFTTWEEFECLNMKTVSESNEE